MGDGQVWASAMLLIPGIDLSGYGVKDIAAIFGIIGSVYGLWKTWRYSKWQIANRLLEYLNAHEKNITEAREFVLERLGSRKTSAIRSGIEIHPRIEKAMSHLGRDLPVEAETELSEFALLLTKSAEVGRRHMALANQQAATMLLFVGLIARRRDDSATARSAFEKAQALNPQDAEASRSLGFLEVGAGHAEEALKQFKKAIELAAEDSLLRAEAWYQIAEICRNRAQPLKERDAMYDCGEAFAAIGEHLRAAQAYARVGEIELTRLGFPNEARRSFRSAFDRYHQANNLQGTNEMKEKLHELGEDVSTLPTLDQAAARQVPWFWIRLALELSLLGAAAYLFLTLR